LASFREQTLVVPRSKGWLILLPSQSFEGAN
jgi:hypothetical protein